MFEIVASSRQLAGFLDRRKQDYRGVAGLLSLEGAHAFEGDLHNIDSLYEAGFRIVGLTHFFDNDVGGSSLGEKGYGLTGFGRALVERLEQKRIIIDLAHASADLARDVLAVATRPFLVTHTGVKAVCPNARNLDDKTIKQIAGQGGLIGIGYDPLFTCAPGVKPVVRSIQYVAGLVGVEHVALGSDFDGLIRAPFDAAGLALITQALIEAGFLDQEIKLIMGENILNFLLANLPAD
jgi:microsomal dipeptidase-like Zn-dependent dipeptidase